MSRPALDPYGVVLSKVLWPAWEGALRRRRTPALLSFLERTQWRSREDILALSNGALRRLLSHAYRHVPYYRQAFEDRGLTPGDIDGRETLSKLPILDRAAARDSADTRVSTVPPEPAISKTTSGTQGMPLAFAYDLGSEDWRNAIRLRSYGWCGYPVGARSLHYWAAPTKPAPIAARAKIALDRGLKRELYVDCTPRGDDALDRVVKAIESHRPDVILTFSQAGAALARHINRRGARTWSDISVICGAERLWPVDREAMAEAFGPDVYETYGSRETMLMACECPAHDGLHEVSENIIIEIVVRDGDRERPAKPGETGDVVVTDLHNLAMPFIRYANGDRATARTDEPCPCGRGLSRIGAIEGRVTETVRDGDGNPVSGLVFNLIFVEIARAARQFQVIQHRDSSITIRIVPASQLDDAHLGRIREHARRYLPGIAVRTELCDTIEPTTAGKHKVVIVE